MKICFVFCLIAVLVSIPAQLENNKVTINQESILSEESENQDVEAYEEMENRQLHLNERQLDSYCDECVANCSCGNDSGKKSETILLFCAFGLALLS